MILDKLLNQENKVLANWSKRKKRFDECQQFILFEKSAQQTLEWIHEIGENYLNTHVSVGSTRVSNFLEKQSSMFCVAYVWLVHYSSFPSKSFFCNLTINIFYQNILGVTYSFSCSSRKKYSISCIIWCSPHFNLTSNFR